MPSDEDQTQEMTDAGAAVAAPSPVAPPSPAIDPLASTLSMQPEAGPAGQAQRRAGGAGRELGTVRLLREIGRGATGSVYLGHHKVLGRDVAVKFLVNARPSGADGDGLKRFLDEARAAAAVRHPHLTQIYHADVDDADGTPYLVLEYVQGPTLKQLLDQTGPMELAAAVAVVADAAAAVHELHLQGLIHRDIKPSNVLLDKDGHVFVTDFGLAMRRAHGPAPGAGPAAAHSSDFAGTPAYMAPEMFDGRVSPRSDVYALGVMTFQLLAGCVPFSGSFQELRDKHLSEPVPAGELCRAGVSPEVVEVLGRALHKQAMFRYKTPLDFARGLKQAARCSDAELSRARKRLCDSIAGRRAFEAAAPAGPFPSRLGPEDEEERPSTTSYPEMLARFATIRRERRTHPTAIELPVDDGSPAIALAATAPAPAPVLPAAAAADPADVPPPVIPGPVLAASVLGILYGTLLAVWYAGRTFGGIASRTLPWQVVLWWVVVMLAGVALAATLVTASFGGYRLKAWARRWLLRYAVADLVFQVLVLLSVLAWVGPATVNATAGRGPTLSPEERASIELPLYVGAALRWLVLSVFPASVLALMTRRPVREAFSRGTAAATAAAARSAGSLAQP
jgi:serine/threonine protein kinase